MHKAETEKKDPDLKHLELDTDSQGRHRKVPQQRAVQTKGAKRKSKGQGEAEVE